MTTNVCGLVEWSEYLIVIDTQDNPLSTIVHEVLHVLYPKATEKDVIGMEELIMEHLSDGQAVSIWKHAGLLMTRA